MRRYALRGALFALGAFAFVSGYEVLALRSDLEAARSSIRELSLDQIGDAGGLPEAIAPTREAVDDARGRADGIVFDALAPLPFVGTQVDSIRQVVDAIDGLVTTASDEVAAVDAALTQGADPASRVALLRTALEAVDRIRADVSTVAPIQTSGLVGPVRSAVDDFQQQLDDADEELAEMTTRLESARDLLIGPTSILVVASNNSEMRAGMGMHLSAGIVTVTDGSFATSPFVPADDLTRVTTGNAAVPPELDAVFNPIWDFGHEWRTTSTTPNFPVVGQVLDQLAELTPIGPVDAVLSLDVPSLAPLLEATGPVVIDGTTIDASNVTDLLLKDIYLTLGDEAQAAARRRLQSRIAGTIFEAITERDVDLFALAEGLSSSAEGRHLMGWSEDPGVQSLWSSLGADGELSSRSLLVAFQNATASKRDYYLDPAVEVTPLTTEDDGGRRFRIRASLANPVVDPTSEYVDSLNRLVPIGVHRAYVTFTLPDGSRDIVAQAGDLSQVGSDGPTEIAAVWIRVPEGETRSAIIDVTFPPGVDTVDLVPSARVRPQVYAFGPIAVADDVTRTVRLPLFAEYRPRQGPNWVAAAALVTFFASLLLFVSSSRRLGASDPDVAAASADQRLARVLLLGALVLALVAGL